MNPPGANPERTVCHPRAISTAFARGPFWLFPLSDETIRAARSPAPPEK